MNHYLMRFLRLMLGLFLCALGIAVMLRASIGYAPWDVFHAGIAGAIGMKIGAVSIYVGLVIIVAVILLGEKLGLGTVCNMILIGLWLDLILWLDIIPYGGGVIPGLFMICLGLIVQSFGCYFYISAGMGAGPRDSLMVALQRKTGLPVGVCRGVIETAALFSGWLLGGTVGVGTVITVFGAGFFLQFTFKLVRFSTTSVKHETLADMYKKLTKRKINA